jgi:hypothetical protein
MRKLFVIAALLGASQLRADNVRVNTFYRTGSLTKNVGAAHFVVRDILGDRKPEMVSCSDRNAFAVSFDGTAYVDRWYSPQIGCSSVAVGDRNGFPTVFVGISSDGDDHVIGYLYAFDPTSYGPELAKVQVSATQGVNDIAVGNADNDAAIEVVAVTISHVYVYDAATLALKWSAPYGGFRVAIADLDGDGVPEIVILGGSVTVLNGVTHAFEWGDSGAHGAGPMAVGDADNDGKLELLVPGPNGMTMFDGDTHAQTQLSFSGQSVAIGDANNDGQNEIITGSQWTLAAHTAAGALLWNMDLSDDGVQGLAVADPDGDGKNEVIAGIGAAYSGADRFVVINGSTKQAKYSSPDLDGPFRVAVGDLGGDGRLEMVITSASTDSGYSKGVTYVLDYQTHRLLAKLPAGGIRVAIGQVDGDAAKEIVLFDGNSVQVFDGVTYAKEWSSPQTNYYLQYYPNAVVRDINGDGIDEIIYLSGAKVVVLNGASNFEEFETPQLDAAAYDFALADLDGDGVQDLVVTTGLGVYVYRTSDWSQRTHITLDRQDYRGVAAMPGHFAVTLAGNGLAVYSGTTFSLEWSCTTNGVQALAFGTIGGQARLVASMIDGSLRFYPVGGSSCPAFETGPSLFAQTLDFQDIDGDGRPELLAGGFRDVSISTLGWSSEPRGDADADGLITDADLDALAAHFYGNRAAAPPQSDVNGDGAVRPDDLFFLINYRRGSGAAPPQ